MQACGKAAIDLAVRGDAIDVPCRMEGTRGAPNRRESTITGEASAFPALARCVVPSPRGSLWCTKHESARERPRPELHRPKHSNVDRSESIDSERARVDERFGARDHIGHETSRHRAQRQPMVSMPECEPEIRVPRSRTDDRQHVARARPLSHPRLRIDALPQRE